MRGTSNCALVVLLTMVVIGLAATHNVPADYETIQAAIEAAENGDTILVQPGEYRGHFDFSGKNIVIASLRLTTGDAAYIDSTHLVGSDDGRSVVVIRSGEDRGAILDGFTIRDGDTDYGGGVYVREAGPTLRHLVVTHNYASGNGGGVYCAFVSDADIHDIIIEDNEAVVGGGGISIWGQGRATVTDAVIRENTSQEYGGGIQCSQESESFFIRTKVLDNVCNDWGGGILCFQRASITMQGGEISGNSCPEAGGAAFLLSISAATLTNLLITKNSSGDGYDGIYIYDVTDAGLSNLTFAEHLGYALYVSGGQGTALVNSIIWSNGTPGIGTEAATEISYCDIEGGQQGVDGNPNWGEGNIEEDPLFVDPENGDYHLADDSPCIDAGDPDSDPDPDGTRADMSAFFLFQGGVLFGHVCALSDSLPLAGANIWTSTGVRTITDSLGFYSLSRFRSLQFDLTASIISYADSVIPNLNLMPDDTLQLDFYLRAPRTA